MKTICFVLSVFLLLGFKVHAQALDHESVERAIQSGVKYLNGHQRTSGSWQCMGSEEGTTALVLLALLKSGMPVDDPVIQKGFSYLEKHQPDSTYAVSLLIMALEAGHDVPGNDSVKLPEKTKKWMQVCVNWLLEAWKHEYWGYKISDDKGDLSNTQFAVLALRSASRCGIRVPEKLWHRLLLLLLSRQQNDGPRIEIIGGKAQEEEYAYYYGQGYRARGWGYQQNGVPRGSMTAAGTACVLIARSELNENPKLTPKLRELSEKAINDGMAWLAFHFMVERHPSQGGTHKDWLYYYLYTVERVGSLSRFEFIGIHNWYREGAKFLVARQGDSGAWDNPVDTCFALLFLKKATRPLIMERTRSRKIEAEKKIETEDPSVDQKKEKPSSSTALIHRYLNASAEYRKEILKQLEGQKISVEEYLQAIASSGNFLEARGMVSHLIEGDGLRFNCTVFVPPQYKTNKKFPLLLLLPGAEDSGIQPLHCWLEAAREQGILLAVCEPPWPNGWSGTEAERSVPLAMLRKMLQTYSIDSDLVFLVGHSDGGHCAWEASTFFPDRFAGAITTSSAPAAQNLCYLPNLFSLSFYSAVGVKDEPELARNLRWAVSEIKQSGGKIIYQEYPKQGHSLMLQKEARSIARWITSKKRNLYPSKIDFYLSHTRHGRHYWVEVLETQGDVWEPGKTVKIKDRKEENLVGRIARATRANIARVAAGVSGNKIDIQTTRVKRLIVYFSPKMCNFSEKVSIWIDKEKRYHDYVKFQPGTMLDNIRETGDRQCLFYSSMEFLLPEKKIRKE